MFFSGAQSVAGPGAVTYTYDEAGRLKGATYSNGSTTTYTLDAPGNRKNVAASLDTTAPSIPAGLTATGISQTQINLSWNASSSSGASVAGYRVYRNGTQVGTATTTTYSDTGLAGFTSYMYTVAAYDNATPANVSAQSSTATAKTLDQTAPSVPSALTATATSQSQVNLSWGASTDSGGSGLSGYRVYRGGTQVGTTTGSVTTYSDTGLAGFTTYSYTVAAYDAASPVNVSAQSAPASAKTLDQTAPAVPTGLTATAVSSTQINLTWSASTDSGGSGLAGYKVLRGGIQVGTPTGASFNDTGLSASTAYSYSVASYDNAGNVSGNSTSAVATTLVGTTTENASLTEDQYKMGSSTSYGYFKGNPNGVNGSGRISPATLTGGVLAYVNFGDSVNGAGQLSISGFTSDPGAGWLVSATGPTATLIGSAASYSFAGGVANWVWFSSYFGFGAVGTVAVSVVHH